MMADKLREVYKGYRIFHDVQKFAQPWRYSYHNSLSNKWQKGEKYLASVHEADYNLLLGTTHSIPTSITRQVLVCPGDCGTSGSGRVASCTTAVSPDCYYEWQTISTYIVETTVSDGLLPSWAQKMKNISIENVYYAEGVSHAEAANHPEVFKQYNKVFNRTDKLGVPLR